MKSTQRVFRIFQDIKSRQRVFRIFFLNILEGKIFQDMNYEFKTKDIQDILEGKIFQDMNCEV